MTKAAASRAGSCCGGLVTVLPNDRYTLGVGVGHHIVLAAVSTAGLILLVRWAARRPTQLPGWAVGLTVGGGAANIVDRIRNGDRGVTDFLNIANVIVINLADLAVLAGISAGLLILIRRRRGGPRPAGEFERGRSPSGRHARRR